MSIIIMEFCNLIHEGLTVEIKSYTYTDISFDLKPNGLNVNV